ncbi:hypothetical protein JQC72_01000 [Polycladomyces sp. WAk]|uniref:Uncharacterized protein n=1 Tax=Polycladomyces zharkentensis TaxID=2807616 RepID=A0ABS2WEZ1_9BACL|nr:hypothetical protein [Polycladomyces sp. WAk]MBN2908101.1 hypothetical protein [Polycladomyces sp. WAk]
MSPTVSDQQDTQHKKKKEEEEEKEPLWERILDFIFMPLDAVKAIKDWLNLLKLIKWIFQGIAWVLRGIWRVITSPFD